MGGLPDEAHAPGDDVLNEYLWKRGREHPPRRIRIKAIKFEDGSAVVSLPED